MNDGMFVQERLDVFGRVVRGRRSMNMLNDARNEFAFAQRHYNPLAHANQAIKNLRHAVGERLGHSQWHNDINKLREHPHWVKNSSEWVWHDAMWTNGGEPVLAKRHGTPWELLCRVKALKSKKISRPSGKVLPSRHVNRSI